MQVLAGQLRQRVDLMLQCIIETAVLIAEIDRRVPHLKIEVRDSLIVKQVTAVASRENLRRVRVMNGIAVRTVTAVFLQEILNSGRRSGLFYAKGHAISRDGALRSWMFQPWITDSTS